MKELESICNPIIAKMYQVQVAPAWEVLLWIMICLLVEAAVILFAEALKDIGSCSKPL
ncbi:hypothetical protein RHMOL_Rhmol02G0163300 [Rhododendron molle]|uniref:Uncharacterized protein n=1 Tax=Rhododendron molle TaxID=49168 RepID=A0ACC0PR54_RHOML|nr:hypothetical protein RHMOL_Rhmol02G0163300 [Rhododendron molle]